MKVSLLLNKIKFIQDLQDRVQVIKATLSDSITKNQKRLVKIKKIFDTILEIFNQIDKELKFQRDLFSTNMSMQFERHEKLLGQVEKLMLLENETHKFEANQDRHQALNNFTKLISVKNKLQEIESVNFLVVAYPRSSKGKLKEIKDLILENIQKLTQFKSEDSHIKTLRSEGGVQINEFQVDQTPQKQNERDFHNQIEQLQKTSKNILNSFQHLKSNDLSNDMNPQMLNRYLQNIHNEIQKNLID